MMCPALQASAGKDKSLQNDTQAARRRTTTPRRPHNTRSPRWM